jgi:hypothetical protein
VLRITRIVQRSMPSVAGHPEPEEPAQPRQQHAPTRARARSSGPQAFDIINNHVQEISAHGIPAATTPLQVITAGLQVGFALGRRRTTAVKLLVAQALATGTMIHVTCVKARGCPVKTVNVAVRADTASLDLARRLGLRSVSGSPTLVATFSAPGALRKTYSLTCRRGRTPLRSSTCRKPGGTLVTCF